MQKGRHVRRMTATAAVVVKKGSETWKHAHESAGRLGKKGVLMNSGWIS